MAVLGIAITQTYSPNLVPKWYAEVIQTIFMSLFFEVQDCCRAGCYEGMQVLDAAQIRQKL